MRKSKTPADPAPIGYSYIRFSSDKQSDGDSLRRQTDGTIDWCKRNGVILDTSTTMKDLGVSAFRGKHRNANTALGAFLKLAEDGRIPKGSYLIIENLDRLSREDERTALRLWMDILDCGINIVQLFPETIFRHEKSDLMDVMRAIIELSRGHSESRAKSERLSSAWAERRKRTREYFKKRKTKTEDGQPIYTKRLPAWIKAVDGYLVTDDEKVEIVQRIFEWSIAGKGSALIVKQLTDERIEPWGRGDSWSKAYVRKILTGRAVLGELQMSKKGEPEGEPIRDYFPRVIDERTWDRAQSAMAGRKDTPGRIGKNVASLFTGLLQDAETRTGMLIAKQTRGAGTPNRQRKKVLVNAASMEGRAPAISFPYNVFESAVLACLREINPADVIGEEPEGESASLAGELSVIERKIRQLEEEMLGGEEIASLVRVARKLEESRTDLVKRLRQAQQKEANPRSAAWGEMKSLLAVSEDEDNRLRLKGLLRNVVDKIWVLILPGIPRASSRLAIVQVYFAGGDLRRDYVIQYWSAGNGRKGGYRYRSLTTLDVPGLELVPDDLRTADGVNDARGFYESLGAKRDLFELLFTGSDTLEA